MRFQNFEFLSEFLNFEWVFKIFSEFSNCEWVSSQAPRFFQTPQIFSGIWLKFWNFEALIWVVSHDRKTSSLSSWNLEAGSHGGFCRRGGSRLIGPSSHSSISSNSIFKYFIKCYVRVFTQILYSSISSNFIFAYFLKFIFEVHFRFEFFPKFSGAPVFFNISWGLLRIIEYPYSTICLGLTPLFLL